MMLIEEAGIPDAVLPIAEFKAHLRLGTGFGDESLQEPILRSFLRAAIAAIEARTSKALLSRSFTLTLNLWRNSDGQVLPLAPVTAITRLDLVDPAGERTTVPADRYRLEKDSICPRLRPTGGALPWVPQGGSVEITLDAGYGANWSDLPADLALAVLLLAAHYYEFRHETQLGEGCMPFGVTSLIERHKVMRTFAGRVQ